jgi:hypothetical protein
MNEINLWGQDYDVSLHVCQQNSKRTIGNRVSLMLWMTLIYGPEI